MNPEPTDQQSGVITHYTKEPTEKSSGLWQAQLVPSWIQLICLILKIWYKIGTTWMFYHTANRTHVADKTLKWTPSHVLVICQIHWSSALIRKIANVMANTEINLFIRRVLHVFHAHNKLSLFSQRHKMSYVLALNIPFISRVFVQ